MAARPRWRKACAKSHQLVQAERATAAAAAGAIRKASSKPASRRTTHATTGLRCRAPQSKAPAWRDSLAEWSKALAQGASPQGRGFEPHSCHPFNDAGASRRPGSTLEPKSCCDATVAQTHLPAAPAPLREARRPEAQPRAYDTLPPPPARRPSCNCMHRLARLKGTWCSGITPAQHALGSMSTLAQLAELTPEDAQTRSQAPAAAKPTNTASIPPTARR